MTKKTSFALSNLAGAYLLLLLLPFTAQAQYTGAAPYCGENGGLVINEWSNGTGGSQEYVEFVVVGDGLVDLEGYIINDNSAAMSGVGNADGYLKFGACYAAVPAGSILVVYNASDANPALPAADPTDADGDGVYVIPHTDACLEGCYANPSSGGGDNPASDLHCPCADATPGGFGWPLGFSNSNDLIQVLDPCETVQHALSYGLNENEMPPSITTSPVWISFAGSGGGSVFYFSGGNWHEEGNFTKAGAAANQTPGAANDAANATFIAQAQAGSVTCGGAIQRCEKTDAGDLLAPTDLVDINPATANIIELCEGDDLGAFAVDYSAADENEPPADFGGVPYDYAFVLTETNAPTFTIVAVSANGDFDLSAYPAGSNFFVWGFSYIQTNGSVDIFAFLNGQGNLQNVMGYDDCGYHGDLEMSALAIEILPGTPVNLDPLGPFCLGLPEVALPSVQDGATGTWSGPGVNAAGTVFVPGEAGQGTATLTFTPTEPCRTVASLDVEVTLGPVVGTPSIPLQICYTESPFSYTANFAEVEEQLLDGQGFASVVWLEEENATIALDLDSPEGIEAWVLSEPTMLWATLTDGLCINEPVMVPIELGTSLDPPDGLLRECPVDGSARFTPSDADEQFTGGDPNLTVTYYVSEEDAEAGNDPVTNSLMVIMDGFLWVRVENSVGCYGIAQLTLDVLEGPTPGTPSGPLEIMVEDNPFAYGFNLAAIEAEILDGQSGLTINWYTDGSLSNPIDLNDADAVEAWLQTEPTMLWATLNDGTCDDSGLVVVDVQITMDMDPTGPLADNLAVPNVFTPNGDGNNDRFQIFSPYADTQVDVLEVPDFRVFNRWGQIIYEAAGLGAVWDGTYKGEPAPADTYIYYIRVTSSTTDEEIEFKGSLMLVR